MYISLRVSLLLSSVEMIVGLSKIHKVSMCPRFYHPALMNHSYHIGVVDGRETVSNDNGGSPLSGLIESFLDNFLTLCVQGRSGLVKKKDFRISNKSSCDGNSLLLSTTQLGTLATNICGIALHHDVCTCAYCCDV